MKKQDKGKPGAQRFIRPVALLLAAAALLALAILVLVPRGPKPALANPESNVLLITLDTTRPDRMGYAGYSAARTPSLDGLAAAGVRCDRATSPVPLTLPAHCTILSGQYPPAHQVRNNGSYLLPPPVLTLAEILAGRGYRTSAFVSSFVLDSRFGLDQGFAVYDDELPGSGARTFHSERDAAAVFAAFSGWLERRGTGRFFSWVHFYDPHAPYAPPEPYRSEFAGAPYDGEIAYMDHYIGEIVARLEAERLLEHTLIVVVGDHGEAFGEHGEHGHQVFCYEENLQVPLIFRADGFLPHGRRMSERASLADVLPTVLDFLRLPMPAGIQGRSLLPAMQGKKRPAADVYLESYFAAEAFRCAPVIGLIRGDHKYLDLPRPELYDLRRDPGERKNLVSGSAVLARSMKAELRALQQRLAGAPLASSRRMSDEERNALASLGYIASAPPGKTGEPLLDPKDGIAGWEAFSLGIEQQGAGEYPGAEASLRRAIEIIPDYPGSYTTLANVYHRQGRGEQGLALLRQAMSRLPADATLKIEHANLLAAMGQTEAALARYQELAKTDLFEKEAYVQAKMAAIHEARGDTAKAIAHYRRARAAEPDNDDHLRRLAFLLHSSSRFAEALELYRDLERRHADDVQLIRDMAVVLAQLNDLERSRAYFLRALQRAPDARLYFNYALLLARLGETDAAAAAMERFLAAEPAGSPQAEAGRRHLAAWRRR